MQAAITGEPVPGTFAAEDELFGIGRVLGELGEAAGFRHFDEQDLGHPVNAFYLVRP